MTLIATDKHSLDIGDSIGLVALVLGLLAVTITPPLWLKIILLVVAVGCLLLFVVYSKWTYPWAQWKKLIIFLIVAGFFLWLGISQAIEQFRSSPQFWSFSELTTSFNYLKIFAQLRWVQWTLCAIAGSLLTLFAQSYRRTLTSRRAEKLIVQLPNQPKGLFDFKLQAEEAIAQLSRAVEPISKVIDKVGKSLNRHTSQIRVATNLPTRFQVRIINSAAADLKRYSRQLTLQLPILEDIGTSLAEGLPGWLRSITIEQRHALANSGFAHSLAEMIDTLTTNVAISDQYLSVIGTTRGISQQFNDAVEEHLSVIAAIKHATEKVRLACILALSILTDTKN